MRKAIMVNDSKLAFIVGHYKSGSTWLLNLLSIHPEICGTGEAHVFNHAWTGKDFHEVTQIIYNTASWGGVGSYTRHKVADLTRPIRGLWRQALPPTERPKTRYDLSLYKQKILKKRLENVKSSEEYAKEFFSYLLETWKPHKYLIEKSPNNIYYVSNIKKSFPNAKLLSIYRDGRDFVVSHKFFSEKLGRQWNLKDSIESWKKAIYQQFNMQKSHDIYALSYESLQNESFETTQNILNFLNVNYDNQNIYEMIDKSSFQKITGRKKGIGKQDFYRKGVSGDWRNHLSETDKDVFKELAGDLLIELGYEKDYDW